MTEQAVTESNGTTSTNGNGKAAKEPKPDSALQLLLKQPPVKFNDTDKKKITSAFKAAMSKRAELQKALDDFDAQSDATAVQMVKCYGSKHIVVDGVRYVPTSRGARVYYKKMSDSPDVIEL